MLGKGSAVAFEGPAAAGCSDDDARVVSWSPRCRELLFGGGNTTSKLMRREIGGIDGRTPPCPDAAFCAEKFRRFKLQEKFSVQTGMEIWPWVIKSIIEIIPANDFVFVMDSDGLCVAFHQTGNSSIAPYEKDGSLWYFNNFGDKMRSMFYNKINDSVITVSYSMPWTGYKMRAIPLESIRRRHDWGSGIEIFGSPPNKLPIFDSCNSLAVICLYQNGQVMNNIYETKNYEYVHSIPGEIRCITTRPGIMIVAHKIFCNTLPIKVFSTENWVVLKKISYPTPPLKTLQIIGLCCENILLKEKDQNVHLIDLWNHSNVTTIENSENARSILSFDLIANNVLLKFQNDMVVTCNPSGVQVPLLRDARNDSNRYTFPMHVNITRDKKYAILYSLKIIDHPGKGIYNIQDSYSRTINICSTFNGKSIVEVNPRDNLDLTATAHNDSDNNRTNEAARSAQKALKQVTAVAYDEEHHMIFTGNATGYIHVWST